MKSISQQTNSLVNIGDIILIKTPLPIDPNKTTILGYEVITKDIIDFKDWVGASFAISLVSLDNDQSINQLNWINLGKDEFGQSEIFNNNCKIQKEPYYIYFRFEKLASSGQIINITKVNLKIQDSEELEDLKNKYPYYYQSIFNEDTPNNSEVLTWQYNVLDKVSGTSILPKYIEKDKDFSIFWGWISHFFAIIVHFGRSFRKIFNGENIDLVGEFFKEKGYFQDSRVKINQDLKISLAEEIIYTPIVNTFIDTKGYPSEGIGYFFSGYLPIKENNIVIFKIGGYNKNLSEYIGKNFTITISYYRKDYTVSKVFTLNIFAKEAIKGKRLQIINDKEGEEISYIGFSYYYTIGSSKLPLIVRVFIEGEGNYKIENRTKEEIFNIYPDFRKRGTEKSSNLIKKILETKKEDGFYANYLDVENIGWFLNKSCPINKSLIKDISIDSLVINKLLPLTNGLYVEYNNQYLTLNQNTTLKLSWNKRDSVKDVIVFASIYDKDKNPLSDVILGNWKKNYGEEIVELKGAKDPTMGLFKEGTPGESLRISSPNHYKLYNVESEKKYLISAIIGVPKEEVNLYYICYFSADIASTDNLVGGLTNIDLNFVAGTNTLNNYEITIPEGVSMIGVASLNSDYTYVYEKSESTNLSYIDSNFDESGIKLIPIEDNGEYIVKFPINLVRNLNENKFGEDYDYGNSLINNNLYLISKVDGAGIEAHYLKIDGVVFRGRDSSSNDNVVVGHKLVNEDTDSVSPKVEVFINMKGKFIHLIINNQIVATWEGELTKNQCTVVHFIGYSKFDFGYVIFRTNVTYSQTITLFNPFDTRMEVLKGDSITELKTSLLLRKLPMNLGFLNNKQYYLCCFKNNGKFSNEEAKEIIDQKVLPYNGMRLFVDNSLFYDELSIPLQLKQIKSETNKETNSSSNIYLKIKGGVSPYKYYLDNNLVQDTYSNEYINEKVTLGNHIIEVIDKEGNQLKFPISCQPYNNIDYKLKIYIDINQNIDIQIYLFGGTNTSYTVNYPIDSSTSSIIIPSKSWTTLKNFKLNIKGSLSIEDNNGSFFLTLRLKDLFKNLAIDFYDDGEGQNVD